MDEPPCATQRSTYGTIHYRAELTDATLTVEPATKRVTGIAYHDREGNLTRFDIADYQDLPRQGRFTPPAGIKWEEQ